MTKIYKFLPSIVILALLTVGVTTHCIPLIYTGIIAVCIAVILVAFNVLKENQYAYLLFAIALGMTLQLTLSGSNLIGPDVHLEYYWAQFYAGEDVWHPLRFYCPAAGIGAVFFAPLFQKVFAIPNLWTFKVIFPICFAFVPVVLYHLFKRWIGSKRAFLAAFMFVAFPSFLLEIPGIPESMLAELFMVLAIYLTIVEKYRLRYRIPLIIACALLSGFTHYSVGFITIIFLGIAFIMRIILQIRNGISHKIMAVTCASVVLGSLLFFSLIADGAVMLKVSRIWNGWVPQAVQINYWHYPAVEEESPQPLNTAALLTRPDWGTFPVPQEKEPDETVADKEATEIVEMVIETSTERIVLDASTGEVIRRQPLTKPEKVPFYKKYHDLMKVALGLDFANVDTLGRTFRILLWIFMLCMAIGTWKLRKNREFWIFASGAVILALACLNPRVSPILNASRFAHYALIALVPTVIMGSQFICRKSRIYVFLIIVPFFLFTSGFIFEATKSESTAAINIPYSFSLTNARLDLGASVTPNDYKVMEWIAEHKEYSDDVPFPIFADAIGTSALGEITGYRPDLVRAFYKASHLMPRPPWYALIRERNVADGKVVIYDGIGQRDYYPIARYRIDINKNILYQVGDARVIYVDNKMQWEVLEIQRIDMVNLQEELQEQGLELSLEQEEEYLRIRTWLDLLKGYME